MTDLHKFYHRGNNDAREGDRLTAVFDIKLTVGDDACKVIEVPIPEIPVPDWPFFYIVQETGFFLPDFVGDDAIAFARTMSPSLPAPPVTDPGGEQRPPSDRKGQQASPPERKGPRETAPAAQPKIKKICLGDVPITVAVAISSPAGQGNGEFQAGQIAARFGLEFNGQFLQFTGGALPNDSEHWQVSRKVQVGTIPCKGGVLQGSLKINSGQGAEAAYEVTWEVAISACGRIAKSDFALAARAPQPGLGAGGRPDPPLKEVKEGDSLPYPLKKDLPGNGPTTVGPAGQPTRKP